MYDEYDNGDPAVVAELNGLLAEWAEAQEDGVEECPYCGGGIYDGDVTLHVGKMDVCDEFRQQLIADMQEWEDQ